jgi:hypothetical protein
VGVEKAFTFEFLNIVKLIHIKNAHLSLKFLQKSLDHIDPQTLKSYSDNSFKLVIFHLH